LVPCLINARSHHLIVNEILPSDTNPNVNIERSFFAHVLAISGDEYEGQQLGATGTLPSEIMVRCHLFITPMSILTRIQQINDKTNVKLNLVGKPINLAERVLKDLWYDQALGCEEVMSLLVGGDEKITSLATKR